MHAGHVHWSALRFTASRGIPVPIGMESFCYLPVAGFFNLSEHQHQITRQRSRRGVDGSITVKS